MQPGEQVTVAGFSISRGMIYVGGSLPTKYGQMENCLIDPELEVSRTVADREGASMSYWPAYGSISKSARRAYLEWLASERNDPTAYIGYIFLYFYGLERRLFVDGNAEEARSLIAEVQRLLSIYGHDNSFRSYANRLLDAASLLSGEVSDCEPSLDLRDGFEISFRVRRHLGRKMAAGENFDAQDALIWVLALPDTFPRTPVVRCFEELKALWSLRFNERHPEGLKVRAPKTRVRAQYRSASGSIQVELIAEDLPDIAAVRAPVDGLCDLLGACSDELDAYSRLLGRRPDSKGTPEALLLLPADLASSAAGASLASLRAGLDGLFGGEELAVTPLAAVVSLLALPAVEGDRMSTTAARQLGGMLDLLDVGFEPDRRYGSLGPAIDGQVVLFRAAKGGPIDPDRPEVASARTMVEVAVLAAQADGVVVPEEFEAINSDLKAMEGLSAPDRLRLLALALALLSDPPKHQAAINRLIKLPAAERARTTQSAISAVLADGRVTPSEVKFLERLHKALGLPQEDVYAALHRGSVRFDEPVPVAPERWTAGTAIPQEAPTRPAGLVIDHERLERVRRETSAVSQLLAGIFVEEAPPEQRPAAGQLSAKASAFPGLDGAHASLLQTVLATGSCDRPAFEDAAKALRLFADGALETINEWAFETFDEPLLEGDDIIVAVDHLRDRAQQMGAES